MPCNMMSDWTPGDQAAIDAREAQQKAQQAIAAANQMADILCRVLRSLPPAVVDGMDDDVRKWFEAHKAWDATQGRP